MCLRSHLRKVLRIHGVLKRNRGNPEKVQTILDMASPKTVKEVQNSQVESQHLIDSSLKRRIDVCLSSRHLNKLSPGPTNAR